MYGANFLSNLKCFLRRLLAVEESIDSMTLMKISTVTASRSIVAEDNNSILVCSSSDVVLTFEQDTLPIGFSCVAVRSSGNLLSFAVTGSAQLKSISNFVSVSDAYGSVSFFVTSSNVAFLSGPLS